MGVASRLVQAAFATCEPLKTSLLEVRASNHAAQSLYRKLGFEEFNVRRRYYDDGEDAIEMKLQLPHS
jgi:ribosomal protein S18 acetylase RimI-like enzyme